MFQRRLIVWPVLAVAFGSLSACANAPSRTQRSLASTSVENTATAQEVSAESSNLASGNEEDGAHSLAREVEQNAGVKQGRLKKAPAADQEAALGLAPATDEAAAGQTAIAQLEEGDPQLPLTAMLPQERPGAASMLYASQKSLAGQTQVASLDPTIGVSNERFGVAEGSALPLPTDGAKGAALADDGGDPSHSKPAPQGRLGPSAVAARSPELDELMAQYAAYYGVPEKLVRRVAKRESTFNPKARNGPYLGLMQISHATARGMGYRGSASGLLDAETNLKYAVRYLRGAYIVARGNHDKADRLYQTGYYYHAKRAGLLDETGVGVDRKRRRNRI